MRISDWSSDVCSSDLVHRQAEPAVQKNKIALQVVGSLVVGSLVVGLLLVGFQYMISSFRQDIDKSLNPSCLVQLLAETNSRPFKKRVTHHNKFLPSGLLKDARYLGRLLRSEEHTSELQSLMRISYAVFCLKKKKTKFTHHTSEPN